MDIVLLSGGLSEVKMLQRYIGPYKVAHWLRKHGYSVQVVDFMESANQNLVSQILKKFISNKTLVLGLSTTFFSTTTFEWSDGSKKFIPEFLHKAIQDIKSEFTQLKVVIGGYMSDKIPSYDIIDASVMSYTSATEEIFLEYVNHLRTGSEPPKNNLQFPLFSKSPRKHYYEANTKTYNIETDDFSFIQQDCILPGEPLPLDVSRGCIFACRFCQYPHIGKKKLDYIRGMTFIEEEILSNYHKWGTTSYYILDDTFNDTEIKIKSFNEMSNRLPFTLNYTAYIRADLVNRFPDTADQLLDSGMVGAYHGIESLHPEASKLVGKGWSGKGAREYIPKLYHDIWDKKVAMQLSFIVGLTGETKEDVYNTSKWFIDNNLPSIRFNPLGLFGDSPGSRKTIQSEFDRNSEKYGYTIHHVSSNGRTDWSNDLWTNKTANEVANQVMSQVKPYLKHNSWAVPGLLWYGHTLEQIRDRRHHEYDNDWIKKKTESLKKSYFEKIIDL
jgi:radical SAM superfamily enzyme YgiQ (UPF0313 family)